VVINDVDAGVYGEYKRGAARKARCVVGVFPGTGIGGGCVYEGRIVRGKDKSCFEIGHCQVQPDGPLCGCGRRGCLEAVSNRLSIAAAAATAAYRGEAPHLLEEAGTDIARIRSSVLARSIKAGDEAVERIVRQAAAWLGVGIAATVNLMNPDVVVLGGGMVEAMPELFLEEVGRSARAHVMSAFKKDFTVAVAELGDDAGVIGAAAWAKEECGGG
jgi:glucokinase